MIYPIGGCSTHPIIHVAVAVADKHETYGALAAAENNNFINTNNSDNNANNANNANNNANNNSTYNSFNGF